MIMFNSYVKSTSVVTWRRKKTARRGLCHRPTLGQWAHHVRDTPRKRSRAGRCTMVEGMIQLISHAAKKWVSITFGHRWSYIEHPLKCDDSSWFPLQKSAKNQAQIHQFAVSFLGRFPGQTSSRSSHPPEICGRIFCSACGFGKIRFHQGTSQAFFRRSVDFNRTWGDFSVYLVKIYLGWRLLGEYHIEMRNEDLMMINNG